MAYEQRGKPRGLLFIRIRGRNMEVANSARACGGNRLLQLSALIHHRRGPSGRLDLVVLSGQSCQVALRFHRADQRPVCLGVFYLNLLDPIVHGFEVLIVEQRQSC